jgi:hypothetical protein
MARVTSDELWSLVVETGLCSRRAAAALRAEHDAASGAAGADAKDVAAWLVDKGVLTRWQAKRLASGDTGPFFCGDYRLLERHDHDGEAFEFTARHEPSGRTVCVVLLGKRLWRDATIRDAIVRRMTIATQATDPLLVRTWALEEADGRPFAVCEEVRGESLADELARRGPLPLREAGEITLAAARAVASLHAAGEVHGGLSLDALLRDPADADGRLRLRQFPLATDPHQVPPRALVANEEELLFLGRRAAFVAPELASGAACDARSDVYALGCILHALIAGAAPGWSGDARATLDRVVTRGPDPLDPAVAPAQLTTLVGYMTSRDPRDRYPDAGEAARAIATCFGFPQPEIAAVVAPAVTFAAPVAIAGDAAIRRPAESQAARAAATEAARRRGRRLRVVGAALAGGILAFTVVIVALKTAPPPRPPAAETRMVRPRPRPPEAASEAPASKPREVVDAPAGMDAGAAPERAAPEAGESATVARAAVVVDDPTLPWASPTSGAALVPTYLPAGSRLIVAARPADMLGDEEGRLLVRALGPGVEAALAAVAAACGCAPEDVETLQAGWQAEGTEEFVVGWTARLVEGKTLPDDAWRNRTWGPGEPFAKTGETIHVGTRFSFWAPKSAGGRVLVTAPKALLEEIVAASAGGDPPVLALSGDLGEIVGVLDDRRHLTVFGSPFSLLNAGRALLAGPLEPLAAGIERLLGDTVQAAALSVHCGTDFYVELDAVAPRGGTAAALAASLAERIAGYPAAAKAFCAARDLHPYGRALVMELPTMVRALAAQVRAGAEGKAAVVNAYLPRHAGHNIALATELALAQAGAGGAAVVAPVAAAPAAAQGALVKLGRKMTLVFAKDELERSIQMVSDEIGVPMEIRGPDLQLEGITKNQPLSIDERDKPAADILRVILAKANPDGKLVYVVRTMNGVESIEITTRAGAAKRGDVLPPAFQDPGAEPKKGAK